MADRIEARHDDSSSKAMFARIKDIQRDVFASNARLESLVACRSVGIQHNATHNTKRLKVGFQSILFNFSIEISSEEEDQPNKGVRVAKTVKKSICNIRLPSWFVQDQYNMMIRRAQGEWLFHPSIYRTVSYHCSFFVACKRGDLEKMKMLLVTKQAYLGDRSSGNESALSWTILSGHFGACKLLLEAGILNFFESSDYKVILEELASTLAPNRDKSRELLRLMGSEQNTDSDWLDELDLPRSVHKVIHDLRCCAEATGGSDLDRLEASVFPSMFPTPVGTAETSLRMLSKFLEDADHVTEVRVAASRSSWLLFVLAENITALSWDNHGKNLPKHAVRAFCSALSVMCGTGLDLHAHSDHLSEAWQDTMRNVDWITSQVAYITPFTLTFALLLFPIRVEHNPRKLTTAMSLWVHTLHSAGEDLASYAAQEVSMINKLLKSASSKWEIALRISHGPKPDDWGIETGPPGEAHPAYFWRSIEAAPICEDLAVKVLDLTRRVNHPETAHCKVPGSWQAHGDELEQSTWKVKGWLAYMEDGDLSRMEADLEGLDDEEFCKVWDLRSELQQ